MLQKRRYRNIGMIREQQVRRQMGHIAYIFVAPPVCIVLHRLTYHFN